MRTVQKCFAKIVHIHKKEKKWKPETSPTSCLLTTQVGIATSEAGLSVLCEKHRINKVRLSLSTQTVTGYMLCKTWRCTIRDAFPSGHTSCLSERYNVISQCAAGVSPPISQVINNKFWLKEKYYHWHRIDLAKSIWFCLQGSYQIYTYALLT